MTDRSKTLTCQLHSYSGAEKEWCRCWGSAARDRRWWPETSGRGKATSGHVCMDHVNSESVLFSRTPHKREERVRKRKMGRQTDNSKKQTLSSLRWETWCTWSLETFKFSLLFSGSAGWGEIYWGENLGTSKKDFSQRSSKERRGCSDERGAAGDIRVYNSPDWTKVKEAWLPQSLGLKDMAVTTTCGDSPCYRTQLMITSLTHH